MRECLAPASRLRNNRTPSGEVVRWSHGLLGACVHLPTTLPTTTARTHRMHAALAMRPEGQRSGRTGHRPCLLLLKTALSQRAAAAAPRERAVRAGLRVQLSWEAGLRETTAPSWRKGFVHLSGFVYKQQKQFSEQASKQLPHAPGRGLAGRTHSPDSHTKFDAGSISVDLGSSIFV